MSDESNDGWTIGAGFCLGLIVYAVSGFWIGWEAGNGLAFMFCGCVIGAVFGPLIEMVIEKCSQKTSKPKMEDQDERN